jgi:hypothetical protein
VQIYACLKNFLNVKSVVAKKNAPKLDKNKIPNGLFKKSINDLLFDNKKF